MLFFLTSAALSHAAPARERWGAVVTPNFFVAGNDSDTDLRQTALKLEQFREVLARLFGKVDLRTSAPLRVLVFKDQASYDAVRPLYRGKPSTVTGFLQPGSDVHYIGLLLDNPNASPWAVVLHEYVHALQFENLRIVPLWFAEGLAEYFSTFEVLAGEKRVRIGSPVERHLATLKSEPLIPIEDLFAVDRASPRYNEAEKQGVFYAESWALVHYLMMGKNQRRQPKVAHFIKELAAGVPAGDSFRGVFETSYHDMDAELEKYIRTGEFQVQVVTFDQRLASDREFRLLPLTEAQSQFYTGDLLHHMNRAAEAEPFLVRATQMDPGLAEAHAAMAVMRASQGKAAEARAEIEKVPAGSDNYLLAYYRAFVLSGAAAPGGVPSARDASEAVRSELAKAIEKNPAFTESYSLLATYNANIGVPVEDCISLLEDALKISPGRQELLVALARLRLRNREWVAASEIAEGVHAAPSTPGIAAESAALLERIREVAEQQSGSRPGPSGSGNQSGSLADRLAQQATSGGVGVERPDPEVEGEQISGLLMEIVCRDQQMSIVVQAGPRRYVFRSGSPREIRFTSYTPEVVSRIQCGPRKPPVPVVVRYRKIEGESDNDGNPLAVDFVSPVN